MITAYINKEQLSELLSEDFKLILIQNKLLSGYEEVDKRAEDLIRIEINIINKENIN